MRGENGKKNYFYEVKKGGVYKTNLKKYEIEDSFDFKQTNTAGLGCDNKQRKLISN